MFLRKNLANLFGSKLKSYVPKISLINSPEIKTNVTNLTQSTNTNLPQQNYFNPVSIQKTSVGFYKPNSSIFSNKFHFPAQTNSDLLIADAPPRQIEREHSYLIRALDSMKDKIEVPKENLLEEFDGILTKLKEDIANAKCGDYSCTEDQAEIRPILVEIINAISKRVNKEKSGKRDSNSFSFDMKALHEELCARLYTQAVKGDYHSGPHR